MKDKRVVFMGTPLFSVPVLKMLIKETNVIMVVTQKDSLVGRKQEITFSPVKQVALDNNIEVFQPNKIRSEYEHILESNPDIIITCAYGQIVPNELLYTPLYKAINVHASLLPKLRGGAPLHRSIINGYKETGVTIMYMAPGMDDGDIIVQKSIPILENDNVGNIHDKLSELGRDLLKETLPSIFNNTNTRIKQNEDEVTYAYVIKHDEEHIDFNNTTKNIYNLIRGLYPFPVSYANINNEVLKICESRIGNFSAKGKIGEVINIYKDGFGVKTKDGEIIITKVKPSGKKEMYASEYLNGKRNLLGEILC